MIIVHGIYSQIIHLSKVHGSFTYGAYVRGIICMGFRPKYFACKGYSKFVRVRALPRNYMLLHVGPIMRHFEHHDIYLRHHELIFGTLKMAAEFRP